MQILNSKTNGSGNQWVFTPSWQLDPKPSDFFKSMGEVPINQKTGVGFCLKTYLERQGLPVYRLDPKFLALRLGKVEPCVECVLEVQRLVVGKTDRQIIDLFKGENNVSLRFIGPMMYFLETSDKRSSYVFYIKEEDGLYTAQWQWLSSGEGNGWSVSYFPVPLPYETDFKWGPNLPIFVLPKVETFKEVRVAA